MKIDHVATRVFSVASSVSLFRRAGATVMLEDSDWAMLALPGTECKLALLGPTSGHPDRLGYRAESVEEFVSAAKSHVVSPHRDGSFGFYFKKGSETRELVIYPDTAPDLKEKLIAAGVEWRRMF